MSYEDALSEALRAALEEDLPEEDCPQEVTKRAALMIKMTADENG